MQVGVLAGIEVEELGVGEHGQFLVEVVVLAGALQVLRRGDGVEVGDVLGHVGPAALVVGHGGQSGGWCRVASTTIECRCRDSRVVEMVREMERVILLCGCRIEGSI